jgi:hypothetical protein
MRLLQIRSGHDAFHPLAAQRAVVMDECLFALLRTSVDGEEQVLCLHNVSARPVSVAGNLDEAVPGSVWTDLLTGLRLTLNGSGDLCVELNAYQTLWLQRVISS